MLTTYAEKLLLAYNQFVQKTQEAFARFNRSLITIVDKQGLIIGNWIFRNSGDLVLWLEKYILPCDQSDPNRLSILCFNHFSRNISQYKFFGRLLIPKEKLLHNYNYLTIEEIIL